MIADINTPPLKELDLFIGCDGHITIELFQHPDDAITVETLAIHPTALVHEYIRGHWNPETERIDNRESGCLIGLADSLKRCVEMIEQAVYEDKNPDA